MTVDINGLLDVFQKRELHDVASAQVVSMVADGTLVGGFPAHGLTTRCCLVRKHASKPNAETAMDRVLSHCRIGNLDSAGWREARLLPFADFEDAAVATVAKSSASAFIIPRKVDNFAASRVHAISPTDFPSQLPAKD